MRTVFGNDCGVRPFGHVAYTTRRRRTPSMIPLVRTGLSILITTVAVGLAVPTHAESPRERVATMLTAIAAVLQDPTAEGTVQREQRVRAAIFDGFHVDEMAELSLGAHWQALTLAQRQEFVGVYGNFFEPPYNRLVLRFFGERTTRYVDESATGDVGVVDTVVESKKDELLPVRYRLAYRHDRWGVVDVVLDGVSLTANWRTQFDTVIRRSSYRELVHRMKAKAGGEVSRP
jgi:phospholipid transport system substrate-binding protein